MQIERKTMKIKREDIDNMSHISVIAAIALPENLEEAARSIPDEVIKQGMVMEHCLYYSQVQNQHLDLENIVITDQHRYEGLAEALSDQIMAPYSMIPNEQTPKEFEDETEAAIREYETKRDDFVRLLNGRIVPIYDYGFSKDYVVKDGLICKRRFGPLQREKRTKRPRRCSCFSTVLSESLSRIRGLCPAIRRNEFLNWRSGYFTIHRATGIHLWSEGDIEISSWFPSIAHLPSQALMVFLRISTMSKPTHQKDIVG